MFQDTRAENKNYQIQCKIKKFQIWKVPMVRGQIHKVAQVFTKSILGFYEIKAAASQIKVPPWLQIDYIYSVSDKVSLQSITGGTPLGSINEKNVRSSKCFHSCTSTILIQPGYFIY